MDDFLKMDLFFTVTTLAVLVITLLVGYAVYRFSKFLAVLERIAHAAEEDMATFRKNIQKDGFTLKSLVKFLGGGKKKS